MPDPSEAAIIMAIVEHEEVPKRAFILLSEEDFLGHDTRAAFTHLKRCYAADTMAAGIAKVFTAWSDIPLAADVTVSWESAAQRVIQRRLRQAFHMSCASMQASSASDEVSLAQLAAMASDAATNVQDSRVGNKASTMTEAIRDHVVMVADNSSKPPAYMYIDSFDRAFPLSAGLIVVAARPSVGKTILALSAARGAAQAGVKVGFISLEQSYEEVIGRMAIMEADIPIPWHNIFKGWQGCSAGESRDEQAAHAQALERLDQLPILFAGGGKCLDVSSICHQIETWHANEGVRQIWIDYFQLIKQVRTSKYENETAALARSAVALAELSHTIKIPIFLLAQINRSFESESRGTKPVRPTKACLKGTGALEEAADTVILLDRPELPQSTRPHDYQIGGEPADMRNRIALIVDKHRNGPTGCALADFHKEKFLIT